MLININENDEKLFFLKLNLGMGKITSVNDNVNYEVFQVNFSDYSSLKMDSVSEKVYTNNIEEETLYNFENYSFENDLRTFYKKFLKDNKDVNELPRLYFLLNYTIPISIDKYQFITNIKTEVKKNSSYGYAELDFILKNGPNEDIIINNDFMPYKEKLFMTFPKLNISNDKKIILKKNSIIFFEFKISFPQYNWRNRFEHLLKKVKKFLEIYNMRGLYNDEYIQIYLIYDKMPDIYDIEDIKSYMNNHSDLLYNYEFGIYYFTQKINIVTNQMIEDSMNELKNEILDAKRQRKELKDLTKDLFGVLESKYGEKTKEKCKELKSKYQLDN